MSGTPRTLPDIIELPVDGAHCIRFHALTAPVVFRLRLDTHSLWHIASVNGCGDPHVARWWKRRRRIDLDALTQVDPILERLRG